MANTQKADINKVIERFADEALRTLCLAVRTTSDAVEDVNERGEAIRTLCLAICTTSDAVGDVNEAEKDLIMVALIGIEDPVRDE
ncbi:hypothetical protein T484DRAFT_1811836, partial [Baffinella frigidus]